MSPSGDVRISTVVVMPGLDPGIHAVWFKREDVDGRDKPCHDVVETQE
jgi:hypothetical protein